MITRIIMIINTSFVVHSPFYSSIGSVGSKAQGGQPSAAVYNSSVAPVVSQGSGSYSHSAAATTAAPYTTDSSTDYSQYNQAYTQVLPYNTCTCVHTHTNMNAEFWGLYIQLVWTGITGPQICYWCMCCWVDGWIHKARLDGCSRDRMSCN